MLIRHGITARDAADRFAAEAFSEPRRVGQWRSVAGRRRHRHHADFRLVGGSEWFQVYLLVDYSGWNIEPVVPVPVEVAPA